MQVSITGLKHTGWRIACMLSRDMSLKLSDLGACLKRLTCVSEKACFWLTSLQFTDLRCDSVLWPLGSLNISSSFRIVRLRGLLLLFTRKPGVSALHGNICFRVFCLPCFSNLVQQIFYVTGTLLRSCGCPAAVWGFVLHKPTAPRAAASVPVTGGEGLPMAVYQ